MKIRKGAPKKNMFGSIRRCDAVIGFKPCLNRATFTLVPDRIEGVYGSGTHEYWCASHIVHRSFPHTECLELLSSCCGSDRHEYLDDHCASCGEHAEFFCPGCGRGL